MISTTFTHQNDRLAANSDVGHCDWKSESITPEQPRSTFKILVERKFLMYISETRSVT